MTCARCGLPGAIHTIGYHAEGIHMGEIHLCDPCFGWALKCGYIDEPFIDAKDFARRTRGQ